MLNNISSDQDSTKVAPMSSRGLLNRQFESVQVNFPGTYSINTIQYREKHGALAISLFKFDLGKAAFKNQNFLSNLAKDKVTHGMWYYGTQQNDTGILIAKTVVFQGVVCPICKLIVETQDIIGHRMASKCYDQLKPPAEFQPMSSSRYLSAISKAGNVPYVFGPIEFDVFVPKWVHTAIDQWQSNSKKYAGLSLSEYLNKMASDNQSE